MTFASVVSFMEGVVVRLARMVSNGQPTLISAFGPMAAYMTSSEATRTLP